MIDRIKKHLSTKLSLTLLLLAMPIFILSLGLLFVRSRDNVRTEATEHAESVLNTSMQRLQRYMNAVETATNFNDWEVTDNMDPDAILRLTNRVVSLNPNVDGCSVSTEPNVFPKYGRYFSAYTIREGDSIITVVEEEYEYFQRVWYKTPHDLGRPCWVDFFDDIDSLNVTLDGMIASYCKPLYNADKKMVAVISTDLSLYRLSKIITQEKPYPHSYYMMLGEGGHFLIHPDSTRLFTQTVFDNADPRQQVDVIALGHEMTAGNSGNMSATIDGIPCQVCYQHVSGTPWSLAIVCPEDDILDDYHRLVYIILSVLAVGLLVILVLCYRMVGHAIRPLNQLLDKTQSIIDGNMDVHIPSSPRVDAVGRLQNSFATMLQSLNFQMGSIRFAAEQTQRRNEELLQATQLAEEADRRKTAFIQNVSHQIRTPLNIVMGFSQVMREYVGFYEMTANTIQGELTDEEMKEITTTMTHNALTLSRMVKMLYDISKTGEVNEYSNYSRETVSCNQVMREALGYVRLHYPQVFFDLRTEVSDDFCIQTSRHYLMISLRELLYNAAKYSSGQLVIARVQLTNTTVRFIVEDTGKGIAEENRDLMFEPFTKIDDLSEGLGLGLPLSKRHMQYLGGDLTLDASYHDGCRFIAELPL